MFAIVVDSLALLLAPFALTGGISVYVMVVFDGEEFDEEDADDEAEEDDKGSGVLLLLLL